MQLSVGDVFKSKNEAQNAIRMYAVDNSFNFETTDSTPKKYTIQCKERRAYRCDAIVTAALRKKDNMFVIKKLKNSHNCPQQAACTVQSSARYIADELREMPDIVEARIGQLINRISLRRGIKIGYFAAWKARKDALDEEVDEEKAQEECLKSVIQENRHLNPGDVGVTCNMKKKIGEWEGEGYRAEDDSGYIKKAVRVLGYLDTAGSQIDAMFWASSTSLYVYRHSRQIVELVCHRRYNESGEPAGYAYLGICNDAFDSPYLLCVCYVPEYCSRKEGWVYFVKELLEVVDQGVFMVDWEGSRSLIEELEKEIEKKNEKIFGGEERGWRGHSDIEEAVRLGELDSVDVERPKCRLFIRTRSLCKEIFSTHSCSASIGLVWSLCNSPDLATFQMYYKKIRAQNEPALISLLSSLPVHLWAKYQLSYPLYNKNNSNISEIDSLGGIFTLTLADSICMVLKVVYDNVMKKKEVIAHAELSSKKSAERTRFGESLNRAMEINALKSQCYEVDVGRTPGALSKSSWIDPRKLNDEEEHGQGIVYSGNLRFYVDLRLRVCSCMKFQEMGYPCSHACALITKIGGNSYMYVDDIYSVDTLTQMYKTAGAKCIVNEPIRGTEEKRKYFNEKPKKEDGGCDGEEFLAIEQKENIAVR